MPSTVKPPRRALALTTDVTELRGMNSKKADALRRLGLRCVSDLLLHIPHRHEHELPETTIARAGEAIGPKHNAEANIAVTGEVGAIRQSGGWSTGRKKRVEATLMDHTGTMRLVWFNSPWMKERLHVGQRVRVSGKARRHGDYISMSNPKLDLIVDDQANAMRHERFRPVYRAGESLDSRAIEAVIEPILDEAVALLDDHLPAEYRATRRLAGLSEAFRMVHRPASQAEVEKATRRLAFDDLFLMQLAVMIRRRQREHDERAPAIRTPQAVLDRAFKRLPFGLTTAQRRVIAEISADLNRTVPMNRLLQGDVGSGKTAVALTAMLLAIYNKHQAALLAPTELLAEQHAASIAGLLKGSKVNTVLLTGSLKGAERQRTLEAIKSGDAHLVIGTHALLSDPVAFKNLGLVVIDEQHRFGVHQRAAMRKKGDPHPHVLVMTATPIPRSLSMTMMGDLDVSTIDGLPPGRSEVITKLVSRSKADEVYAYLRERVEQGDQAFVVAPAVEEGAEGIVAVEALVKRLANGALAGRRIAAVHGRMDAADREKTMSELRSGRLDVIVATTVIEVGVDVPNASMMIIEQADRFGLSQLHQLRGRVGRGTKQSLFVLLADPETDEARERLDVLTKTTDGFLIAEKDLELRGPGHLFGDAQSGDLPFHVAQLPRDEGLLRVARADAEEWITRNPTLAGEEHAVLRRRLRKRHGEWLNLSDVA